MNLNTVNDGVLGRKAKKRLGRGPGSGNGKTAGRGFNGQGARAGFSLSPVFEGGQLPVSRRVPKRGFNNKRFADVVEVITIATINARLTDVEEINPTVLFSRKLIDKADSYVKVIGNGDLTKSYIFRVHRASRGAVAAIEKAGGKIEFLPGKKPVVKNKMKIKVAK